MREALWAGGKGYFRRFQGGKKADNRTDSDDDDGDDEDDDVGNEFVPSNSLMQMELNRNSSEKFWLDYCTGSH